MKPYKGYVGTVEFDEDDLVFHGRIAGIRDVVTFEAETARDLVAAFHDSVDDYLAFCAEEGQEPQKPFSGRLLLRVPPELHGRISNAAARRSRSVNQWIAEALDEASGRELEGDGSGSVPVG